MSSAPPISEEQAGSAPEQAARPAGRPRVLLVDDERAILRAMRKVLPPASYDVTTVEDPLAALELLRERDVDAMLVDLRMPHMSGIELLERVKELRPDVEVILMTAYGTIETAIEAVRKGAFDYITKPFANIDEVVLLVDKAVEKKRLVDKTRTLERELRSQRGFGAIVGTSQEMREVFRLIESVAPTSANVLIQGETGTGKELVARAIHERSDRAHERMVAVNCSALTETLLESELFGHKRGSFTGATHDKKGLFEVAHRGTLFLDEVGDMAPATQAKLLRALQDGDIRPIGASESVKVDVRVIAATHVDLDEAMKKGRFREDLYWRLNVIRIQLPPLRERTDDIPVLAMHFLQNAAERFKKDTRSIAPEALSVLVRHRWDGNVRELQNAIERAVVLCPGDTLRPEDLPQHLAALAGAASGAASGAALAGDAEGEHLFEMPFRDAKEVAVTSFERRYVEKLLERAGGNVSEAARRAGLDRSNFRRLLVKHGVDAQAFRAK